MISFFNTYISPTANGKINKTLKKEWLNEGPCVRRFEKKLNVLLGLQNVISVNSCSSALLISLLDIDVKGFDVIIPSQTFIATGMAVLAAGGNPVFCDIDYNTGNICVSHLKSIITNNTKAIIPVLWNGYPCDIKEINKLVENKNIKIIQDAAHGIFSKINNNSISYFSDYTCYSFQAIKHLTCGDGGAICTNNIENYKRMERAKWFGINKKEISKDDLNGRIPNNDTFGFKWNMNDFSASLGLANLLGFRNRMKKRIKKYNILYENLKNINLLENKENYQSSCWFFCFRSEKRDKISKSLKSKNLPFSTVDYGIHKNPIFNCKTELKNQNIFDKTQMAIPIHEKIQDYHLKEYIKTINLI